MRHRIWRNADGDTTETLSRKFGREMPTEPEVPIQGDHVWSFFWWLHRRRDASFGSVPSALTPERVLAAHALLQRSMDPAEIDMIFEMDDVLTKTWAELEAHQRDYERQARGDTLRPKQPPKKGAEDP